MIYRFKSAFVPGKYNHRDGFTKTPDKKRKKENWIHYRFGGAWKCGGVDLFGLKAPSFQNTKAKFYFTEKGWKKFSQQIISSAKEVGQVLQVIKKKNPKKSQIVYKDEYQVAIMPDKKKKI